MQFYIKSLIPYLIPDKIYFTREKNMFSKRLVNLSIKNIISVFN